MLIDNFDKAVVMHDHSRFKLLLTFFVSNNVTVSLYQRSHHNFSI